MSLTIILDKSALQRLSYDELSRLSVHYRVAAPRVLVYELLGDLSKDEAQPDRTAHLVKTLSRNLHSTSPKVCADARDMAMGSLLGHQVPLDGRIPMPDGIPIVDSEGNKGVVFDTPPELEALFKWHLGRFTEDERASSLHWRESIRTLDMEAFQRFLRKLHPRLENLRTIADVVRCVDAMLMQPNYQRLFVQWVCLESRAINRIRDVVLKRWDIVKLGTLSRFAPYAYHFLRVSAAFYIGLQVGVITTRKSNWIDVEYLRYLPFCHVFSSGDELQMHLARAMVRADQDLIEADSLKADMTSLNAWWDNLTDADKREESVEYGSQPPDLGQSPTAAIWRKRFGARQKGRGNFALNMTAEQLDALSEKLRPQLEAAKAAVRTVRDSRGADK